MTENGNRSVRQLLADAAAAERSGELQSRQFAAGAGDDDEVQRLFEESADTARLHNQLLETRLAELAPLERSTEAASPSKAAPHLWQSARAVEEQLLQNLIVASAMQAGECALYETLAVAAAALGDPATELLAREIEQKGQATLERLRHLLPSRSKIAFNMLTISEVDPAVETKVKDDRAES